MPAGDDKAKIKALLLFAFVILATVLGMIWLQSDRPLGFWEFFAFWGRELVFLGLAIVGFVFVLCRGRSG